MVFGMVRNKLDYNNHPREAAASTSLAIVFGKVTNQRFTLAGSTAQHFISTFLKHTTTLFFLSDHDGVIVNPIQTNYHGMHMV